RRRRCGRKRIGKFERVLRQTEWILRWLETQTARLQGRQQEDHEEKVQWLKTRLGDVVECKREQIAEGESRHDGFVYVTSDQFMTLFGVETRSNRPVRGNQITEHEE